MLDIGKRVRFLGFVKKKKGDARYFSIWGAGGGAGTLVQGSDLGQVLFKSENCRAPGTLLTKDTDVFAAKFLLHGRALKTLTLVEPHRPRWHGVTDQVNYTNLFCLQ